VTYGGIEAGGTKWVCAVGTGPDDLRDTITFPTTTPDETLGRAIAFFAPRGIEALGVGCFGPIDRSAGRIAATPKPGWQDVPVVATLGDALGVAVAFDTDVNAAALAEHRRADVDHLVYVTVGTGIGGGAVVGGRLLHGLVHPELGHMRVPHDREADPFDGVCPFHGDCLEGLASGVALQERRGDVDLDLEARYLALGMTNLIAALSPQRIVLGGGVMKTPGLLGLVREQVVELVGGYVASADIVAPVLGDRAGVVGALCLASAVADRTPA
jgi:fructokinase